MVRDYNKTVIIKLKGIFYKTTELAKTKKSYTFIYININIFFNTHNLDLIKQNKYFFVFYIS